MGIIEKIAFVVFGVCAVFPVYGDVSLCMNLSSSSTCKNVTTVDGFDWSATCGNNVAVKGMAICSSTSGKNGDKLQRIDSDSSENTNCWCRMIIPTTGYWVYAESNLGPVECSDFCADTCKYNIESGAAFRAALFSDLVN